MGFNDGYTTEFATSLIVINACSSLAASVWNFFIILAFVKTPSLRTPSYILILGLAITDFGVGTVVLPSYCIEMFTTKKSSIAFVAFDIKTKGGWVLSFSSFLTITAITIERFLALHLRLRYRQIVTTKRSCVVLLVIGSLGLSGLVTQWIKLAELIYLSFGAFLLIMNIILMLAISRILRKRLASIEHGQQQSAQESLNLKKYKKTLNTLFYIMGTMAICYLPFAIKDILWHFVHINHITTVTTDTLLFINSALNPVIYCWRIPDMRNAVVQLFRSLRCLHHEQ